MQSFALVFVECMHEIFAMQEHSVILVASVSRVEEELLDTSSFQRTMQEQIEQKLREKERAEREQEQAMERVSMLQACVEAAQHELARVEEDREKSFQALQGLERQHAATAASLAGRVEQVYLECSAPYGCDCFVVAHVRVFRVIVVERR